MADKDIKDLSEQFVDKVKGTDKENVEALVDRFSGQLHSNPSSGEVIHKSHWMKNLREKYGVSQKDLAQELSIEMGHTIYQTSISMWESGKISCPRDIELSITKIFRDLEETLRKRILGGVD